MRQLRHRPLLAAAVLAAAAVAGALLPATAGAASITIWEHVDFRGASSTFDRAVPRLSDLGWNDRVSSLRINSGRWEVCRDIGFASCRTLGADLREIARLESGWNDTLSSLRPVGGASEDSAQTVAGRLYSALLGRDADSEGLRNAAAQIERGQLENLVRGMTQSAEYRNLRARRSAAEILDQMYRGLYGRPADAAARRTYVVPIERGEDVQVVLALLAAGAPAMPGDTAPPQPISQDIDVAADGAGLVVWGSMGRYESLSGAKALLGRDGKARIDLAGTTPQTLTGTWTRESDTVMRLRIPDIADRRADAQGMVMLDGGRLARVEITAGTLGARNQVVFSFVADGWAPPREETRCQQQARARLEEDTGVPVVVLFLAPERSRLTTGRDALRGGAIQLADPAAFEYRCEVDAQRGEVLAATIQRR